MPPSKRGATSAAAAEPAAKAAKSSPPPPPKADVPAEAEASAAEDATVPAQKVGVITTATSSRPLERPKVPLPSATPPGTSARKFMRQICPWVLQELPKYMHDHHGTSDIAMNLREPLTIGGSSDVAGFKEAWNVDNCWDSLQKNHLYEAGGNVCWADPQVGDDESPDDPSWQWVYSYSQTGYVPVSYGEGTAPRKRIRFPISLETYWPGFEKSLTPKCPVGLKLLCAYGHVWSWYVAVWDALTQGKSEVVRLLYESALTATVCVRTDCRPESLATEYLRYSEKVREDSQVLIINFVTFADKVCEIGMDLAQLQKLKLRFAGGLMNATMLKTVQNMKAHLTPESRRMIGEIDRRFGRDVLSGSYSKLRLLCSGCQNKSSDVSVLVQWCLETMLVMLSRKDCNPNDFTVTQFSRARDGTPSWVSQAIATRVIVQHMQNILDNVAKVDMTLANKIREHVFDKMSSPKLYDQCFPKRDNDKEVEEEEMKVDETPEENVDRATPGEIFMSELAGILPRAGVLFAEILRKLFDNTYEKAVNALASENDMAAKIMSGDELQDLTRDLNEMMRAIHVAECVVPSCGGGAGPPRASLRELVRHNSAPEDQESAEAERADVWRRAQTQRKKLVTLGLVKNPKDKTSYAEVFKKASAARGFKGEAGKSHRVFIVSADLMNQCGKEPWLQASAPDNDMLEAATEFVLSQRDTFDVALAFDGSIKACRRSLEDSIGALPASAEFVMVYDKAPNACFQRRNFMSQRNVETGYVRMPMSRTRVVVKDRGDHCNGSGETCSAYTSYSGVAAIPRTQLSMISPEDKAKIFAEPTGPIPKHWAASRSSGVPLFWLETKSLAFFGQMCDDLDIQCVVDTTPGSGILAQCCMSRGITYFGMCSSAHHLQWLSNVLDRAALKYIVESGSFLYVEDLATHITELFADVLESFQANEEDEEAVQESDEDAP